MVLQAGSDVVRLAPSLVIEPDEIDEGMQRLVSAAEVLEAEGPPVRAD